MDTENRPIYLDNNALRGLLSARTGSPPGRTSPSSGTAPPGGTAPHVVTSAIEHPAVARTCDALESEGFEVTRLPVDAHGRVRAEDVRAAMRANTVLVSIVHANNEIGTIEPIAEIADVAHEHGALVHTDAAQSLGKIPVDVEALGVDLLTVAGHKLYAPKGIGALYVRRGVELTPLLYGGGQEGGRRPGTENVLEIVGLGAACEIAGQNLENSAAAMRRARDLLEERISAACEVRLNGHPQERLPNTLNLSFRNVASNELLERISEVVVASAGSACHADSVTISPVIEALGVPLEWARGTVRFSTGKFTTAEEIERAAEAVSRAYRELSHR
ncbi:MAG: cysteine desulfurase family protein [Spirochaetaceae bacterium]